MNPRNDLTQSGQPRPTLSPAPRKPRFRIEKLEERIAPAKGGKGSGKGSAGTWTSGHW